MVILQGSAHSHWNYFLAIERDLEILSRYIEFTDKNYQAYSLEMARIILAAASECDVLAKSLCKILDKTSTASSINRYREVVTEHIPVFPSFEVKMPRFGMEMVPWDNWNHQNIPDWWTAHNKIKHHRDNHFQSANLFNAINSVSALFVLNLYFHRNDAEEGRLLPTPTLLRPGPQNFGGAVFEEFEFGYSYDL